MGGGRHCHNHFLPLSGKAYELQVNGTLLCEGMKARTTKPSTHYPLVSMQLYKLAFNRALMGELRY